MSENPQQEELREVTAGSTPKNQATEPTNPDASPSKEPTGEKDVAVVSLGANVAGFLGFCTLLLFVVATPIPWFTNVTVSSTEEVYIWQVKYSDTTNFGKTTSVSDLGCPLQISYFRAVEAFAIGSIFAAALFVLLAILARQKTVSLKVAAIGAYLSFALSVITWATAIALYNKKFTSCGLNSYSGRQFNVGPGGALFVAGWVLSFFGIVVCLRDIHVPKVIPDALLNYFVAFVAVLASAAAFVFAVIASPISIMYVKDSTGVLTAVTSWRVRKYDVNGDQFDSYKLSDLSCGGLGKTQSFSAAFSIVTIAFALVALIQSIRLLKYNGSLARTAIILFLAAVVGLIKMAADLSLYYKRFCDSLSLYSQAYKLGAGFALSAAVWVLLAAAAIILLAVAITQRFAKGKDTLASWPMYFLTALTFISLTFFILGAALPVLSVKVTSNFQNYYWWNYEFSVGTNTYVRSQDYACSDLKNNMLAGGSLDIVAIAFTALGAILAVGQFFSAELRKPAAVLVLIGSVPALVSWALGVNVYWSNFCGVTPYNSSFRIASGLALVIAGWGSSVLAGLVALFVQ